MGHARTDAALNYCDLPSDPDETGYDVERRALEMVRADPRPAARGVIRTS